MPEKNESSEPPESRRGLAWVMALLVALPLLYFLSTGPVVLIFVKTNGFGGMVSFDFVKEFYRPIIWLDEHTFLQDAIESYVNLWVGK
jgi:hypothetical protein